MISWFAICWDLLSLLYIEQCLAQPRYYGKHYHEAIHPCHFPADDRLNIFL
jgi:hypothetical protein